MQALNSIVSDTWAGQDGSRDRDSNNWHLVSERVYLP